MNTKRFAVIVAGGKGLRMGKDIPKQFMEVRGLPILMHTLKKFYDADSSITLILVLPQSQFAFWETLKDKHSFQIPHISVAGGEIRTASVFNGLNAIEGEQGTVAIHDGVRPFASVNLINTSFKTAHLEGSAIAAVSLKDSIRKIAGNGSSTALNRAEFQLIQTPQTFQIKLLKEAYQKAICSNEVFTDDASVVEAIGHQVTLIQGDYQNIKITTPEDLLFAEAILGRVANKKIPSIKT